MLKRRLWIVLAGRALTTAGLSVLLSSWPAAAAPQPELMPEPGFGFPPPNIFLPPESLEPETLDSDGDGLSDAEEVERGLDPHWPDSNMNGISDFTEVQRATSSASGAFNPDADLDSDGISNFLETYGFYNNYGTPAGVEHVLTDEQWQDFKNRAPIAGYEVWQFAAQALEDNLYIMYMADGRKRVEIASAFNVIKQAYLDKGIGEYNRLITDGVNFPGSVANVMQVLASFDVLEPVDASGQPLPVFFTNPSLASTDRDPYTDFDEAMEIFNAGRPQAPADHPLIAATPTLQAKLESFRLTDIAQTRTTYGESQSEMEGRRDATSSGHSHGIAIGGGYEHTFGPVPSKKVSANFSVSNQFNFGSSVTLEQRNSYSTFSQSTDVVDNNCFAKLGLDLSLDNIGSARASYIELVLNIYLGDRLWNTVNVSTGEFGKPSLSPSDAPKLFSILGQASSESCLTLDEANYLSQGGYIGVETVVANAQIPVYDEDLGVINPNGSWADHLSIIEDELARIDFDVNDTEGNVVKESFYVVAATAEYPSIGLSIESVLNRFFTPFACEEKGIDARLCFRRDNHDIGLSAQTSFDFVFYNKDGELINRADSADIYRQLAPLDDLDPARKILIPRSLVRIVDRAFEVPNFAHIEAINQLSPLAQRGDRPNVLVRTLVRDFYGVDKVFFCRFDTSAACDEMQPTPMTEQNAFSGQFQILLPGYQFTGNEFIKAVSVSGRESRQTPTAFFLSLGENLYNGLDSQLAQLQGWENQIKNLNVLRSENTSLYFDLVADQQLASIEAIEAQWAALNNTAQAAIEACAYRYAPQLETPDLALKASACVDALDTLRRSIASADMQLYELNRLPRKVNLEKEEGYAGSLYSVELDCQLGDYQYLTGISMGKKKDNAKATVWLRYKNFDRLTQTLKPQVHEKRCGVDTGPEKNFNPPPLSGNDALNKAWLILDVGAAIGGEGITNSNNGDVTRMCVRYRLFNFRTGAYEGDRKMNCTGDEDYDLDNNSGWFNENNHTRTLRGLGLTADNGDISEMRGHYITPHLDYPAKPFHTLVDGNEYRILSEDGRALTAVGMSNSSRAVQMQAVNEEANQVWIVEQVNNLEVRLRSKAFPGYLTRSGSQFIARTLIGDATYEGVDRYTQHFRPSQGHTSMMTYSDFYYLSTEGDDLPIKADPNSANLTFDSERRQRYEPWVFEALTPNISKRDYQPGVDASPFGWQLATEHEGYTGPGYALIKQTNNNVSLSFATQTRAYGTYTAVIRYASDYDQIVTLHAWPNASQTFYLPASKNGEWRDYTATLHLENGPANISLEPGSVAYLAGELRIDKLTLIAGNILLADQAELGNGAFGSNAADSFTATKDADKYSGLHYAFMYQSGQSMAWTTAIRQPGRYVASLRYASWGADSMRIAVLVDGEEVGQYELPATRVYDWQEYFFNLDLPTNLYTNIEIKAISNNVILTSDRLSLLPESARIGADFAYVTFTDHYPSGHNQRCATFDFDKPYYINSAYFRYKQTTNFFDEVFTVNNIEQRHVRENRVASDNLQSYAFGMHEYQYTDSVTVCNRLVGSNNGNRFETLSIWSYTK